MLIVASLILPFLLVAVTPIIGGTEVKVQKPPWRIHTLFSVECQNYFDWQTVGLVHSYHKMQQPGPITRLLSCTDEERRRYKGMGLAPTFEVPSMSRHPKTGDWYPAINKPAGIVHWLKHSKDAENVDWVVILDADMIIRGPIIPWELGAEKGKAVAAYYGYLIGCDNILAQLHTKHPELCDKVGGLLAMHIDDLRVLAPMWLSKTEEVREDRAHWGTNITGDIYAQGWISEMYGYSFGAAEVGLHHRISEDLMIYPGYVPRPGVEPILLHYGLPFKVGNWSFSKLEHHEDGIVYDCNRLFPPPPYPKEVQMIESNPHERQGLFLSIECINTLNEGLLAHHASMGCPRPQWSKYLSFLKSKRFSELTKAKYLNDHEIRNSTMEQRKAFDESRSSHPKIHTLFSTECSPYFDWQTVGLIHSFHLSGQPGNISRLLSCTDEDLKNYKGHDLAPTHYVPSMSQHPLTGDWYPAINKPAAVLHWLNHVETDAEFIVILDADMILRGPITPWEYGAERGHPVSTPYEYLIGCDNVLAKIHTRNPGACDKVGGVIVMHIEDLRKFALYWLHKTEEVRADKAHYATNFTGDIYSSGWISEMYGYSFGAAEVDSRALMNLLQRFVVFAFITTLLHFLLNLKHIVRRDILIYPGYVPDPGVNYKVFHYGLRFTVGNWSFDKADWRTTDVVNTCWAKFPEPPSHPSDLTTMDEKALQRDLLSIECGQALNRALQLHHGRRKCPLYSIKNSQPALLDGKIDEKKEIVYRTSKLPVSEASNISLLHGSNILDRSLRIWMIGIWALSVVGFLVAISMILSKRKVEITRSKKTRKKNPYTGVSVKHYDTESSSEA
ncbi:hypothetical protein IEQ34_008671 [Dendrobium chrysotoxum]|uniref:Hydroxyproline O-arabinosyltransferase-like domain-containing protein n=1 Tax=Dendrobium chrysotoxum TaxID=161865 RepID=A0AAV7GWL8_DENCH|nr:hypothetical protein IEQ34_008671 [Dendrobium chrysotoxum]